MVHVTLFAGRWLVYDDEVTFCAVFDDEETARAFAAYR